MRPSAAFFALGLGLLLPCLPAAFGAWLSVPQFVALFLLGFAFGTLIPAALDLLTHNADEDAASLIRQRDALTEQTRVAVAERWAKLNEPVEVESDDADTELRRAWGLALDRFFRAGAATGGFSIRKLEGVVGSDTWGALVHHYGSEAGWNVLRDAGGDTGYTWGHGWSLDRVTMALHAGRLPFPDMPVPVVQVFVANTTQRNTPRQRKVIDAEVVKA